MSGLNGKNISRIEVSLWPGFQFSIQGKIGILLIMFQHNIFLFYSNMSLYSKILPVVGSQSCSPFHQITDIFLLFGVLLVFLSVFKGCYLQNLITRLIEKYIILPAIHAPCLVFTLHF